MDEVAPTPDQEFTAWERTFVMTDEQRREISELAGATPEQAAGLARDIEFAIRVYRNRDDDAGPTGKQLLASVTKIEQIAGELHRHLDLARDGAKILIGAEIDKLGGPERFGFKADLSFHELFYVTLHAARMIEIGACNAKKHPLARPRSGGFSPTTPRVQFAGHMKRAWEEHMPTKPTISISGSRKGRTCSPFSETFCYAYELARDKPLTEDEVMGALRLTKRWEDVTPEGLAGAVTIEEFQG